LKLDHCILGRDPDTHENLKADKEFLRLTIPRRTYTLEHLNYVAECLIEVATKRAHNIKV
jgi:tryptophanase